MYSANDIARYVIDHCDQLGKPISNLQLQKILYYIQGYFLAVYAKPAFSDEIYAWKLGPVVPDVYYHYNYFGADPIRIQNRQEQLNFVRDEKQLLDAIIDNKASMSAWQLVEDTHNESPWKETEQSHVISNQKIETFFRNFISNQL